MEDIREKKKTGSGVFHRAARLRAHDIVRTPSESLTGVEKKKVTGPGVVYTTTIEGVKLMEMLEKISTGDIPSREELNALEFSSAQKAVAEIRRLHNNVELIKAWKCAPQTVSKFLEEYQVAKTKGNNILVGKPAVDYLNKNRLSRGLQPIHNLPLQAMEIALSSDDSTKTKERTNAATVPPAVTPLLINVSNNYKAEELQGFLERLNLFLSVPETEYFVEIKVTEVNKKS